MELTAATGYGLTDVAQVSKASDPVTVHDARVGSNFAVDFVTTNGRFFFYRLEKEFVFGKVFVSKMYS